MREFTVAAVKLLGLELAHVYDSDSEGREIRTGCSGVGTDRA